jgi:4-diphosphocytidyl-2-C-methyl-D-erythritol kinase
VSDAGQRGAAGAAGAQVEAQAKVNLRLRLLAREASGYHQIETLFLRLALADTVRVRRTTSARSLDVSGVAAGTTLGPVERNLAWRAADAYADAAGWRGGFAIELEKRIPVGGGLGGGSADAGGVLRILDAIALEPLGDARLMAIASSLGADVPFLTGEHAFALAWGRGERMLALTPPDARDVVLVVPPIAVNTAEAYGWLGQSAALHDPRAPIAALLEPARLSDWTTLKSMAVNDFEPVVAARHPVIAQAVAGMARWPCEVAMMSGSGSVLFGVLRPAARVEQGTVPETWGRVLRTRSAVDVEPVRALD